MSKDNGGPAFPVSNVMALEPRTTAEMVSLAHGMTLRDHFAGLAMQALIAKYGYQPGAMEEMTMNAYNCADAMLEERAK